MCDIHAQDRKKNRCPVKFSFSAAKKLANYRLQPEELIVPLLENKVRCGKKLFRIALVRDAHVCGLGSYDPCADSAIGGNSCDALDTLLPKIRAVTRKRAQAQLFFASFGRADRLRLWVWRVSLKVQTQKSGPQPPKSWFRRVAPRAAQGVAETVGHDPTYKPRVKVVARSGSPPDRLRLAWDVSR